MKQLKLVLQSKFPFTPWLSLIDIPWMSKMPISICCTSKTRNSDSSLEKDFPFNHAGIFGVHVSFQGGPSLKLTAPPWKLMVGRALTAFLLGQTAYFQRQNVSFTEGIWTVQSSYSFEYPLVNYHGNGISPFSIGNTSSKGPFSIAMTFHHTGWLIGIRIMTYQNPYIIG